MAVTYTKKLDVVTEVVDLAATPVTRKITHSSEELSGAVAKVAAANSVSAALGQDTVLSIIEVTVADASTDITFPAPFAGKIVDGYAVKVGTSANAGDVLVVSLAGVTILSFALNVADQVRVTPTIDIANADNGFAAGGTITVNPTNVASCACVLFIVCKRLA